MKYRYLKNQIYRISFFILLCGLCSSYIAISEEISEENLTKITTEEQSITTMGTEGEKGTGFGIKLINDFLNKNNSQLFIESQEGVGTKFTFTLPVGAENEL